MKDPDKTMAPFTTAGLDNVDIPDHLTPAWASAGQSSTSVVAKTGSVSAPAKVQEGLSTTGELL